MGIMSELSILSEERCEECGAQLTNPSKCEECELEFIIKGVKVIMLGKTKKIVSVKQSNKQEA